MEIICLMGKALTRRAEIEKQLQNLGYHKLVKYIITDDNDTNNYSDDYRRLTFQEYLTVKNSGQVLKWVEYDNVKYGIPRPFGYLKYVMVATPEIVDILKKEYKQQVFQVYIDDEDIDDSSDQDKQNETNEQKELNDNPFNKIKSVQNFISSPFQVKDTELNKAKQQADVVIKQDNDPKRLAMKIIFMLSKLKRYNNK